MLTNLARFEWYYYTRKPMLYITAIIFLLAGFAAGSTTGFSFPNLYKNSPYEITYLCGVLSLLALFSSTLFVAQFLLRETDTRFAALVFVTPVNKNTYLGTRFSALLLLNVAVFSAAVLGIFLGNMFSQMPPEKIGAFRLLYYLYPLLVLALPNIFLCVSLLCSIAWLTRNKLLVYVSGLFIYIIYIAASIFSNSPLIAGAAPASPAETSLFARLDPFGMAAFFEQTRYWTAAQRNDQMLSLSGSFLFNRILWGAVAAIILILAAKRFSFRNARAKGGRLEKARAGKIPLPGIAIPPRLALQTWRYHFTAVKSYLRLDTMAMVKSIPFLLVMLILTGLLSVEFYNAIAGDPRIGANYARTGLMISTLMETLPFFGLLIILFFSSEILWKSQTARFFVLELVTPADPVDMLLGKLVTVAVIPFMLVALGCAVGIIVQLSNNYPVDPLLYGSLFYFVGLPLLISAVAAITIQSLIPHKYAGLAIAAIALCFLQSKLAGFMGITEPLLLFGKSFNRFYGDMNGFGEYPKPFAYQMIFQVALSAAMILMLAKFKQQKPLNTTQLRWVAVALLTAAVPATIVYREKQRTKTAHASINLDDWKQGYENRFKKYEGLSQPSITDVRANIELFPSKQAYRVQGSYHLLNKTRSVIDSVLLYIPIETRLDSLYLQDAIMLSDEKTYQHRWYHFTRPLKPGDSSYMTFEFSSAWSAFTEHVPFNSIIGNGSFIRISRYFPSFGYNAENELTSSIERQKRKMPGQTALMNAGELTPIPYDYHFINFDFTVSTLANQTVVMPGDLTKRWRQKNRNYFQYRSDRPIPFRFALSSARYAIKRGSYGKVPIEIYYDPRHEVNADQLLRDAKKTLAYCEANYAAYPHRVARFAEISAFAEGFGATAYPGVVYMKENGGFYNNLNNAADHDVIMGLAAHELSHQWWGGAVIAPAYKEGGWVLSEMLANYTALMLYQRSHGQEAALQTVRMHLDQYLSNRSYSRETTLARTTYTTPHLPYNKGLVAMYQLCERVGEKAINTALSNLVKKYRYPNPPAGSKELLEELYAACPKKYHPFIDELFNQVVLYEFSLPKATLDTAGKKWVLNISMNSNKYREDGLGHKSRVPFNDVLEAAIYFDDQTVQIEQLAARTGITTAMFSFKKKPTKVVLDPRMLFLDAFPGDNERAVTLE